MRQRKRKCRAAPSQSYRNMVLDAYEVPLPYNLAAAFSTWILLAGYVVLPGAFKSLDLPLLQGHILPVGQQNAIISIASVCCATGLVGISCLWFRFRHNYIWLIGSLFLYVVKPVHCDT